MQARLVFIGAAALALGALVGYLAAPKFHAPGGPSEQRLKERATEYYKAMRRGDMSAMNRLKTPARQIWEEQLLRDAAAKSDERLRTTFSKQALENMERGAQSVSPDNIETRIEGNWALTSGSSFVYDSGQPLAFPLDQLVWVYDHGEWWEYELRPRELNAYGNPPDFARDVLRKRIGEQVLEMPAHAEAPAAGAAPANPAGG